MTFIPEPNTIHIVYHDDVYARVVCGSASISMEMSEYFTFMVPNAKFTPAYRNKMWDGKIRLYNKMNSLLYCGLLPYVYLFAKDRNYRISVDKNYPIPVQKFQDHKAAEAYINNLNISDGKGTSLKPQEHQIEGFYHAVNAERCLLLSPTGSGKSFIIYSLLRYMNENIENNKKILIIVPTISLVYQMNDDFKNYSKDTDWNSTDHCHMIHGGQDKNTDKGIVISTWQSVYDMPASYFKQYDAVIVDESHHMKSNSIKGIMEKLTSCKYKIGLTGTLDGMQTNKLVVEGLTGKVKKIATTKTLIDKNILSRLKIQCINLAYRAEEREQAKNFTYQEEIDYLVSHERRSNFICKLALAQTSNTLILYQFVDKHGKKLHETLQKMNKDQNRKIFFISGDVEGEIREDMRQAIEKEPNAIIVASYGTFSTGINIRSLTNIIFASPSKGRIRVLQSIGRQLRKNVGKETAQLYDISDDLSHKSRQNYGIKHLMERIKIYGEEKFDFKMTKVEV